MKDTVKTTRWTGAAQARTVGGRPPPRESRVPATPAPVPGEPVRTRDGRTLILRDIQPTDVDALRRAFAALTPEEVRLRFLHPLTELPEAMARQLCEIDPVHAVALVLVDPGEVGSPEIHAVARAYIDPTTMTAEFALVVQHAYAGQGLGTLLMQRLIQECRKRGAVEIWGDVLADNGAMLELCMNLGFSHHWQYNDPGIQRVTMALQ